MAAKEAAEAGRAKAEAIERENALKRSADLAKAEAARARVEALEREERAAREAAEARAEAAAAKGAYSPIGSWSAFVPTHCATSKTSSVRALSRVARGLAAGATNARLCLSSRSRTARIACTRWKRVMASLVSSCGS